LLLSFFLLSIAAQKAKVAPARVAKIKRLNFFIFTKTKNNLFKHPYAKIEFIERDLSVSRPTATNYLNALAKEGLLRKLKIERSYVISISHFLIYFLTKSKNVYTKAAFRIQVLRHV
jgi:Fic family protein